MPTNSNEARSQEQAADEVLLAQWAAHERWTGRMLALTIGFSALMLVLLFAWFNRAASARLDADLWMIADDAVREGQTVLVDASSRDPKTGKIVHLPELYLEAWDGETSVARLHVQGELRTGIPMPKDALLLRMSVEDPRIGELVAVRWVELRSSDHVFEGERLGGAVPPPGGAGFHAVRRASACGRTMTALAYGGFPVANARNEVMFRVVDAAGEAVPGVRLSLRSSQAQIGALAPVTDAHGIARFQLSLSELAYVEVHSSCEEGDELFGFEVQPRYEGVSIRAVEQSAQQLVAYVDDASMGAPALYELRCSGDVLAYGTVGRDLELRFDAALFDGRAAHERCLVQVYRQSYLASSARALRAFRWGSVDTGWDWAENERGVAFERPSVRTQAFHEGGAALEAWRAGQFSQIRGAFALSFLGVLGLWLILSLRSVRRAAVSFGRAAVDGVIDEDLDFPVRKVRFYPLLLFGWGGVLLVFGGVYFVLSLMGL